MRNFQSPGTVAVLGRVVWIVTGLRVEVKRGWGKGWVLWFKYETTWAVEARKRNAISGLDLRVTGITRFQNLI
jgi:hypothetical protein